MHRLLCVVAVVAIILGGCEGCQDSDSGWDLSESMERDSVFEPGATIRHGAPADSGTTPDACDATRQFIASLNIVDDATITRRPTGQVVEIHEDVGADGDVERCWVRLYDAQGRQVLSTQDSNDPPGPDRIHWVLEFDERFDEPTLFRSDSDGDGVFDREVRITVDDRGLIIGSATDEGIDGVVDVQGWYFYDELGHRTRQETDRDGDGVVDSFDDFQTDEGGRITHWDADWNADGAWDQRMVWTFEGRETTEFWEETLNQETDIFEALRVVTTLDASGRPFESTTDYGDDGSIDMIQRFVRSGNFTTTLWDFENDGIFDNAEVVEWVDAAAWPLQPVLIRDDYGNDGVFDQIRCFAYDALGRQIIFEWLDPETKLPRHRQTTIRGD